MIEKIVENQKSYFRTGETRTLDFRILQLKRLKKAIQKYETEILDALKSDLGKSHFEGYATEVGYTLDSINYIVKNLKSWAKDKRVKTPIHQFGSKSFIRHEPYGNVLIIGPFNYPFQLLIEPMLGAIAAGNTVVLKPSRDTVNTEKIVKKLIEETFSKEYIAVVAGDKEVTTELLHSKFDYILFTGSVRVGKIVMEAAAKQLIPVTLELGGKSPTIVDKDAKLEVAAERIVWGKFLNAGQTCVAPDYIYVHRKVEKPFKEALKRKLVQFYSENPQKSKDYGRIVHEKSFNRLIELIEKEKIYFGGDHDINDKYIAPTILENITWDDKVMEDEIFGPILPIIIYDDLNTVINEINAHPRPLALYVFTESKEIEDRVLNEVSFGGGAINDTVSHVASPYMPFGGIGSSGMGSYHGRYSFETFSHKKSIIKKSTKLNLKVIYPPYNDRLKLIKKIFK